MSYAIGVVCHLGVGPENGGRERNEDNFLVCYDGWANYRAETGEPSRAQQDGVGALVAVCDGMGGHADGDVASATAVQVLRKLYQPGAPRRPARVLLNFIQESHRQLHAAATEDGPVSMGTTLTAAWFVHGTMAWAHVGDSRLYLYRGGELLQLTTDQTRNEFARRDGLPLTRDGEHLVQNFIYGSRGLGDNTELRLEHGLDSGAEVLYPGDLLLLCTDGLTTGLKHEALKEILAMGREPQEAANLLCERAMKSGARDNVSAILVRVDAVTDPLPDPVPEPAPLYSEDPDGTEDTQPIERIPRGSEG